MVEFGISLWESKLKKKVVVTPEDYEYFMNVKIVPHEVQRYIKIFLPLPYNLSDCLTKILKLCYNLLSTESRRLIESARPYLESSPHWEECYLFLGPMCFSDLLINNSVFVPLSAGDNILAGSSYVQISGGSLFPFFLKSDRQASNTVEHLSTLSTLKLPQLHAYRIDRNGLFSSITKDSKQCSFMLSSACVAATDAKRLALEILRTSRYKKRNLKKTAAKLGLKSVIEKHNSNCNYARTIAQCVTSTGKTAESLADLLACNTPISEIMIFVKRVIKILPDYWWRCSRNKQIVIKGLYKIISAKRHVTFSLKELIIGLKISQMSMHPRQNHKESPSPQQSSIEEVMVCLMLRWFIQYYIIPLISMHFHIAECFGELVYYRKRIWRRISDLCVVDMIDVGMVEQYLSEVEDNPHILGVSNMKFQPKKQGVRRISTMGGKGKASINKKLQYLHSVLKLEAHLNPSILGDSVQGLADFYREWKQFLLKHTSFDSPIYFMTCDIKSCYDTIKARQLISIVDKKLTQEIYHIRNFAVVYPKGATIERTIWKKECVKDIWRPLPQLFEDPFVVGRPPKNGILIEEPNRIVSFEKKNLMETLVKHLLSNVIKINGKHYLQLKGIPQGSILSSLLCCIYYGEMERQYFSHFKNEGLLVRMVDDFLFITKNPLVMKCFHDQLTAGIKEFDCFVNPKKTKTNFVIYEDDGEVHERPENEWLPWCGILIQTIPPFAVRADYSSYIPNGLHQHVTVGRAAKPLQYLAKQMITIVSYKCIPLLLDGSIQTVENIQRNVYENFVISALKFCYCVKGLSSSHLVNINHSTPYLKNVIIRSIDHFYASARRKCAAQENGRYPLSYHGTVWLSLHAFCKVLRKKQTKFKRMLILLDRRMKNSLIRLPSESQGLQVVAESEEKSHLMLIKY